MAALSVIATARSWAHGGTEGGGVVKDAVTSTTVIYLLKLLSMSDYQDAYLLSASPTATLSHKAS